MINLTTINTKNLNSQFQEKEYHVTLTAESLYYIKNGK